MTIKPLHRILTLQPLLSIALPLGVAVLLVFFWILPQLKKEVGVRQVQLALAVGMKVESHLEVASTIVRSVTAMHPESQIQQHGFQQHLDALLASNDAMSSLYAVAPNGNIFFVALKENDKNRRNDLINLNLSNSPIFRDLVKNNKPFWSETFLSVVNGGLSVAYGLSHNGIAIIGEIDLALLTKFLKQNTSEKNLLILIVDHNGQVVADNNGVYTAQQLNLSNIPLVREGIMTDAQLTDSFVFSGIKMTGSIIQIQGVDWHVIVAKPDSALYRSPRDIALIGMAGICIALLSSIMVSVFLARKLALRFTDLAGYANDIAQGRQSGEWPVSTIEEFNELSGNLQLMSRRLQDSETLYRTLFEQLPEGVVLWSVPDLRPIQFNTAAHDMLGYTRDEFSQLTVTDIDQSYDRNEIETMLKNLRQQKVANFESIHLAKDGKKLVMHVNLQILDLADQEMILATHHDFTERKKSEEERMNLEQQFHHAQKLESLGVLAGGIAHDFNNILTIIMGLCYMARENMVLESEMKATFQKIESAGGRAAELCRQMLTYAGKSPTLQSAVNLAAQIDEVVKLLQAAIKKNVTIELVTSPHLPEILGDPGQIQQVVMNLIINAAEAIGDSSGIIKLVLTMPVFDSDQTEPDSFGNIIKAGSYICLEVSDTGSGMDEETQKRIFEPFFTTKFTGRGLGMSAIQGIIKAHAGMLQMVSKPGVGTTFKVYFPVQKASDHVCSTSPLTTESQKAAGTVLLVDDEQMLRDLGGAMLESMGFSVITAQDGQEALKIFMDRSVDIDAILLDLIMPVMGGIEAYRELRKTSPVIPVIICSGYGFESVEEAIDSDPHAGFMHKPFKPGELRDVIMKMMKRQN